MYTVCLAYHRLSHRTFTFYTQLTAAEYMRRSALAAYHGLYDTPLHFDLLVFGPEAVDVDVLCICPCPLVALHYAQSYGWGTYIDIADERLLSDTNAITEGLTYDRFQSALSPGAQTKIFSA